MRCVWATTGFAKPLGSPGGTAQAPWEHVTPAPRTDRRERCRRPSDDPAGLSLPEEPRDPRSRRRDGRPRPGGQQSRAGSARARPRPLPVHLLPRDGAACQACPGLPWECGRSVPSGSKAERGAAPSLLPPKGRILRCPEARGEAAGAVPFALAPSARQSPDVPRGYILTRKPPGVRESLGRPPGLRGPPWSPVTPMAPRGCCSHASRARTHPRGVRVAAPPRAPQVGRGLPAFRPAGCRLCPPPFSALFSGSLLEEAFVFLL